MFALATKFTPQLPLSNAVQLDEILNTIDCVQPLIPSDAKKNNEEQMETFRVNQPSVGE